MLLYNPISFYHCYPVKGIAASILYICIEIVNKCKVVIISFMLIVYVFIFKYNLLEKNSLNVRQSAG